MSDEDGGDAVFALQPFHLDLHVEPQILVERAERLVEQQHLRVGGQTARKRGPLLLASGELTRLACCELAHMHEREHLGDPFADALPRPLVRFEPIGHVLGDRHVRKERIILKHDAGPAAARRQMVD